MEPTQPTSEQPKDEASRLRDIIIQSNRTDGSIEDLSESVGVNTDPTLENLESTKEQLRALKAELEILKGKVSEYQTPLEKSRSERQAIGNRIFTEITREEIMNKLGYKDLLLCLRGIGSPESMSLRERIIADPKSDKGQIAMSLVCVGTPESIQMRRLLLNKRVPKNVVLKSLAGATSEDAMEMRKELYTPTIMDYAMLDSLSRIDSPEAMEIRQKILNSSIDKLERENSKKYHGDAVSKSIIRVTKSLNGLCSPQSMAMRQQLMDNFFEKIRTMDSYTYIPAKNFCYALLGSLAYVDTPEASTMRKKYLENVRDSKAFGFEEELNIFLGSLEGVENKEAMKVRRNIIKKDNGSASGIRLEGSVINSLAGTNSPSAFRIRNEYFKHSSGDTIKKAINLLQSLRETDSQEANKMRKKLLKIDPAYSPLLSRSLAVNLAGVYSKEAFELRRQELNQDPKLFAESIGVSRARFCRYGWEG